MLLISLLSAHNSDAKARKSGVNTVLEQVIHIKPSVAIFPLWTWAILATATDREWASEPRCITFSWASVMSLCLTVVTTAYGVIPVVCLSGGRGPA